MPEFISDGNFKAIPGYDNYYINMFGIVVNKKGHILTSTMTKKGPAVDLRHNGQRERVLISKLLKKVRDDCAIGGID